MRLAVSTEEGVVNLELPNIAISFCPALRQRLAGLMGVEGVKLE